VQTTGQALADNLSSIPNADSINHVVSSVSDTFVDADLSVDQMIEKPDDQLRQAEQAADSAAAEVLSQGISTKHLDDIDATVVSRKSVARDEHPATHDTATAKHSSSNLLDTISNSVLAPISKAMGDSSSLLDVAEEVVGNGGVISGELSTTNTVDVNAGGNVDVSLSPVHVDPVQIQFGISTELMLLIAGLGVLVALQFRG
jgi:hypothetical protein